MLNPRKLKRNDVVIERKNRGYAFYGRVWKRLDNDHVIVIDCGRYVQIYHEDELELSNYKFRYEWQHHPGNEYNNPVRVRFMTGLRKLKKMAKRYNPTLEAHRYADSR